VSDIARDEHLRAALRHAPDAALAAPEPVSAQILAAAHRAAAEPAPVAPGRRRWWPLPVWRLGASGALASVLLAGVVGLLWHEAPPGPASEDDAAPPPAAAPAGRAMVPPAAKAQQEATAPMAAQPVPAPTPTPTPTPAPAPTEPARTSRLLRTPPQTPAPGAAGATAALEPAAAAVPRAAASPAPIPQAPALDAAGPTQAAQLPRAVAAEGSAATASPPALSRRETPSRAPALAESPAAPPAAPMPPWAGAPGPSSGAADLEARDAAAAWLRELARQTSSPWRDAVDKVPPPEPADFVLSRGGATAGRLWLRDGQALWCDAAGRCQLAPLRPGAEAALRQGLPPQPR